MHYLYLKYTDRVTSRQEMHSSSFQYSPLIDNENFAYVHHMLVYLCGSLNGTQVNDSAPCNGDVGESVVECRNGELIAAWAVGGEVNNVVSFCRHLNGYSIEAGFIDIYYLMHAIVEDCIHYVLQDFIYPENVAYPIGGPGSARFLVMEMHYDNPDMRSGMYVS